MTAREGTCSNGGRKLETKPCGRCGGSGKFSWCQMYGDRCFGCRGTGVVYTKRGAAAAAFFERSLEKPVLDIVIGDVIFSRGFTAGSFSQPNRWLTVVGIRREVGGSSYIKDGVRVEVEHVVLECDVVGKPGEKFGWGCSLDARIRVRHSDDDKRAKYAAAVAYQDTLTMQGKPRVRRGGAR